MLRHIESADMPYQVLKQAAMRLSSPTPTTSVLTMASTSQSRSQPASCSSAMRLGGLHEITINSVPYLAISVGSSQLLPYPTSPGSISGDATEVWISENGERVVTLQGGVLKPCKSARHRHCAVETTWHGKSTSLANQARRCGEWPSFSFSTGYDPEANGRCGPI